MKPIAVILMGMAILVEMSSTAMSQEPFDLKNMTCHIASADTNGCTGIPTLHSGVLAISKEGAFKLKAHYEGCFMVEKVTKSGRYQVSRFKETMSLELLATKTTGMADTASDFPRTLGFANLNYGRLDGYFIDISAVIRGRGRHAENIITSKLQCEVDE
jgi:glyoxylate carboligase